MKVRNRKEPINVFLNNNILGRKWAEKSGDNYKYFMVFESKNVDGCYTAKSFLDIVGEL